MTPLKKKNNQSTNHHNYHPHSHMYISKKIFNFGLIVPPRYQGSGSTPAWIPMFMPIMQLVPYFGEYNVGPVNSYFRSRIIKIIAKSTYIDYIYSDFFVLQLPYKH